MADAVVTTPPSFSRVVYVQNLDDQTVDLFNRMLDQLTNLSQRNQLRAAYHDQKQTTRNLGIAFPDYMRRVETVIGWPAKAVDALERRIRWDGITAPGGGVDPMGLDGVFNPNQMDALVPQAIESSLVHSLSWIFTTRGDAEAGEPPVVITTRSALGATGLWDGRRRQLRAAMTVQEIDSKTNQVTGALLYLPDRVVGLVKRAGVWASQSRPHSLGRVPAQFLPYRPSLDRPFGRSKISRAVMSLTDQGVRTMMRTEIGAEFFSAPQRYLLDLDPGTLTDGIPGWAALIGHVLAMERSDDPDAKTPTIGQFAQQSMTPHTEHLRSIASMFAAEANIPVDSMGIVHENPSSDAAMHTAYLNLVQDAERTHTAYGWALQQVAVNTVMIRDNLDAPTPELMQLRSRFRDPSNPTQAAATDAVVKQVAAGILPPDSDVTLEALGYDAVTIRRIREDRRSSAARQLVEAVKARVGQPADPAASQLASLRGGQ